eukprot:SM000333S12552  [mRNA]  locus=s333:44526:48550:+ [translate_table: standard]
MRCCSASRTHGRWQHTSCGATMGADLEGHVKAALGPSGGGGGRPLSAAHLLAGLRGSLGAGGRQEDAHEFLRIAVDSIQTVCLDEAGGEKAVDPPTAVTTLVHHIFGGRLRSQVVLPPLLSPLSLLGQPWLRVLRSSTDFGAGEAQVTCGRCGHESSVHEGAMDLAVEIHSGDVGSVASALAHFTSAEVLDGNNRYKCDRCEAYVRARKKLSIDEAPNVLAITLKRFQSGRFGKINKRVAFTEMLDLAPYMSARPAAATAAEVASPPVYRLFAVVVHLDFLNAAFFGHYVCFVRDSLGRWFKVDDSKITQTTLDKVLLQKAYLLFYARLAPRPAPVVEADNDGSKAAASEAAVEVSLSPPLPLPKKKPEAEGAAVACDDHIVRGLHHAGAHTEDKSLPQPVPASGPVPEQDTPSSIAAGSSVRMLSTPEYVVRADGVDRRQGCAALAQAIAKDPPQTDADSGLARGSFGPAGSADEEKGRVGDLTEADAANVDSVPAVGNQSSMAAAQGGSSVAGSVHSEAPASALAPTLSPPLSSPLPHLLHPLSSPSLPPSSSPPACSSLIYSAAPSTSASASPLPSTSSLPAVKEPLLAPGSDTPKPVFAKGFLVQPGSKKLAPTGTLQQRGHRLAAAAGHSQNGHADTSELKEAWSNGRVDGHGGHEVAAAVIEMGICSEGQTSTEEHSRGTQRAVAEEEGVKSKSHNNKVKHSLENGTAAVADATPLPLCNGNGHGHSHSMDACIAEEQPLPHEEHMASPDANPFFDMNGDDGSSSDIVNLTTVLDNDDGDSELWDLVARERRKAAAAGGGSGGSAKPRRNELCPCGSQRKWKKCCGVAAVSGGSGMALEQGLAGLPQVKTRG